MTKEEAIRILDPVTSMDELVEIEYYAGFRGKEEARKAVDNACVLAVAAIREQEEREQGCEYCNGLPFSQMEDFTMPNASKKDYDIVTIRYCPICGRRLPQPPKEDADETM